METNNKSTSTVNVYEVETLSNLVIGELHEIKEWSNLENYRLEFEIDKANLKAEIANSSKSMKKDINLGMRNFEKHPSIKTANRFLHTIFRKLLDANSVRVKVSEKEEKIQLARKAWKEMAAKAEELRLEYKTEKSDFYKR